MLILRESLGDELVVRYTPDPYLDEDERHIRDYHDTYALTEVKAFMEEHGFVVRCVTDRRVTGRVEINVGIPHRWRTLVAVRIAA